MTLTGEKIKVLEIEMMSMIKGDHQERIGLVVDENSFRKDILKEQLLINNYNTTFLFLSDPLNKNKPDMIFNKSSHK
ncbi:hypothetical protein [Clostridium sp. C8-1-8]|uniref:hypothetical protein n=1 Tax=Clostridium sp. C8-1-8 TaxID=2698831 RepID=UPI00136C1C0E|nr:hypothetical protein [Clostridium sp. C8-1-8]